MQPARRTKPHLLWSLAAIYPLIAGHPAQAQNRGVYPLGMSAINSGVTPEPGLTYSNQLLFYVRDQAKDDNGGTLPITGSNTVVMDMNTLTWVSTKRILGARYSASATLPFAKNDLTSDIEGPISGGSGFADSYYLPLILGWSTERAGVRAMYGFLAPTGRFAPGADSNVGSGYWTHTLSSGQTFYLAREKRLVFSAFEMYEFHTTQEGTGIHPGQTFDLDYSLMGVLHRTAGLALQVGVTGYGARQTTAKVGPEITAEMSAQRYAVNAFGFAVNAAFPKRRASVGFRFFKEFANRSTFQGYSAQISAAIHL
uniref:Protein involved in MetA-pathway of phenol degradation n=1 Tax=Solibacter usitatus (strain Ellin6076) TaxID=234267 RepID=Q01WF0_SOLUE